METSTSPTPNRAERRRAAREKKKPAFSVVNKSQDEEAKERANAFLQEYEVLRKKHGIKFVAKLNYSDSGLLPQLGLMIDPPVTTVVHKGKDGEVKSAQRLNPETGEMEDFTPEEDAESTSPEQENSGDETAEAEGNKADAATEEEAV